MAQDVGTPGSVESYAGVKGQTCFQSPYQERPSEREVGSPGGQAGGSRQGQGSAQGTERDPAGQERERGEDRERAREEPAIQPFPKGSSS